MKLKGDKHGQESKNLSESGRRQIGWREKTRKRPDIALEDPAQTLPLACQIIPADMTADAAVRLAHEAIAPALS